MRRVIHQMLISLDGFFEGPNGDISWHIIKEDVNTNSIGLLDSVDLLVFGRRTYDIMVAYWPTIAAKRVDPAVAQKMNSLKKVVFSRTLKKAEWENTALVGEATQDELSRLKRAPGGNIAVLGSSNLSLTLIRSGFIDEFRILVNPLVLGKGKTLFDGLGNKLNLDLLSAKTFPSGSVLLCYNRRQQQTGVRA